MTAVLSHRDALVELSLAGSAVLTPRGRAHRDALIVSLKQAGDTLKGNETQEKIVEWAESVGASGTPGTLALRLLEEVLELCDAAGTNPHDIVKVVNDHRLRGRKPSALDLRGEVGDVDILLCSFSNRSKIDRREARNLQMAINRERNWRIEPDGRIYHE